MRFFVLFVVAVVAIIGLSFFRPESVDENNRLIISAYVINDNTNTQKSVTSDDCSYKRLNVGENYTSAPTYGVGMWNINLYFEYDGIIDVSSDNVQISRGKDGRAFFDDELSMKGREYGYNFHINYSGHMSFYPLFGCYGYHELDEKIQSEYGYQNPVGHEYFVTVNAYADELSDIPTSTAVLKFTKLKDDSLLGNAGTTRFFSIELVSLK